MINSVKKIHSISGVLELEHHLMKMRPFRTPHHNISLNALIGGGTYAQREEHLHIMVFFFWMNLLNLVKVHWMH